MASSDGDGSASTTGSGETGELDGSTTDPSTSGAEAVELPLPNGGFDAQLGGAYPPPVGVVTVLRDRKAPIAPGLYSICYINGFRIQGEDESFWLSQYPNLILRDGNGDPVLVEGEMLFDVSTAQTRADVADILSAWIGDCADAGFNAVDVDGLDSYLYAQGHLSENDAVRHMTLLADMAHGRGLAVAHKNTAELLGRADEMGADFAIVEECSRWNECGAFIGVYGELVLMIEYRSEDFMLGCGAYPQYSIVLRDAALSTPSDGGYVYDAC